MAWEGMYGISLLELKKLRPESDNFLKCHTIRDSVYLTLTLGTLHPSPAKPDSLACFLGLDLLLGGGVL